RASTRPIVGELVLPAVVQATRPTIGASSLVLLSEDLYVSLGLQSGDRVRCRSGSAYVVRRATIDHSGRADEAILVDTFVREDLILREQSDIVGISRDPLTTFWRAFSANSVPALLAFISVVAAQAPLGGLTYPVAVAAGLTLFVVAFQGERSRID